MTTYINQPPVRRYLWLSRLIAIVALINLMLVCFDISYIPWRDFYLKFTPQITKLYDPIKGIEPHRDTQKYLNQVDELEQKITETGLDSAGVKKCLDQLANLSDYMIQENPFAIANKSGQLEKIKNLIRDRIKNDSSRQAFQQFWSQAYLSKTGWQQELAFFNSNIRPLMQTNYYRHLATNGQPFDKFWLLDLPFVILFSLDYLVRVISLKRNTPHLTLLAAILRRWYDIFLLLPFWRWLRLLPVTIRLHQSRLINLDPIKEQINHDFVANFAEEMTEVVGMRMISQMQDSIKKGEVSRWLLHSNHRRPYIDINNTNEVQAIASRIIQLSVYDVIPQIQPDLQALLHQLIENALSQSPVYKQLHNIPGVNNLQNQLAENLARDLTQTAYKTLTTTMEDPAVVELTSRLMNKFTGALEIELKKKHHQTEIESLLIDMLEEIKINYVKGIAEGGVEKILSESEQVRQIVRQ